MTNPSRTPASTRIRRVAVALALLLGTMSVPAAAAGDARVAVEINGEPVEGVEAIVRDGRVLIPVRGVLERLGAEVRFDPGAGHVVITRANVAVLLRPGDTRAVRSGVEFEIDPPPVVIEGRTHVPARFVAEALGDTIAWVAERRTVTIVSEYARRLAEAGQLPPPEAAGAAQPRVPFTDDDVSLLEHLVSAEAWGEPFEGMVAVVAVVINRVLSPSYPDTIRDVVLQPGQFGPVRNGSINGPVHPRAREAVMAALYGEDPSQGALYFYNPDHPAPAFLRSRPVTVRIGNHVFAR